MPGAVLVSIDCLRPEAVGCYEGTFPFRRRFPLSSETPNIDRIARDGVRFSTAICQAPFTPASHASIFTGTNPYRHGIRSLFGCELREDIATMAEAFSEDGYATGAFIGAHALSTTYGLQRGFDRYDENFDDDRRNWLVGRRRPGHEVTDRALEWLPDEESFFLFAHYFDVHDGGGQRDSDTGGTATAPSRIRQAYRRFIKPFDAPLGRPLKRTYDLANDLRGGTQEGIRYHLRQTRSVDQEVGRLISVLEDRDIYDETAIVVMADHGDAFGEHGEWGHNRYLYDTTLRIPLIVKPPGGNGRCLRGLRDDVVRSIDVYPTIARMVGIDRGDSSGVDLFVDIDAEREAYAETRCERPPIDVENPETDYVALRDDRWKLVVNRLDESHVLYDLKENPEETVDRSADETARCRWMRKRLDTMLTGYPSKEDDINGGIEGTSIGEHLEGLGYL